MPIDMFIIFYDLLVEKDKQITFNRMKFNLKFK